MSLQSTAQELIVVDPSGSPMGGGSQMSLVPLEVMDNPSEHEHGHEHEHEHGHGDMEVHDEPMVIEVELEMVPGAGNSPDPEPIEVHEVEEEDKSKIDDNAAKVLLDYHWPGNVRELQNIIERAVILEKASIIQPGNLPQTIKLFEVETISPNRVKTINELNRDYAERILDFVDNNRLKAAELLGISRTSLWRILKK